MPGRCQGGHFDLSRAGTLTRVRVLGGVTDDRQNDEPNKRLSEADAGGGALQPYVPEAATLRDGARQPYVTRP